MNEQSVIEVKASSSVLEEERLILDTIDKFLEKDVKPFVREFESEDKYPKLIADKMAQLGLFGATISPEYGGLGLSAVTYSKIVENVSAVWMSVSGIFNSHLIMCAAVERFGSKQMKEYYLPKFASGEIRGGIALTEPDCGTDLQSITTKAVKDNDSYIINGNKTWITNSVQGSILAVLVKTDSKIKPAHKGMSLILVEKKNGYVARKLK
ncbi:acyl-CoA dehydrogenase family protein, partial [bacterium]|nr:acyl-CoA dehydrogenase family protein [bacterium]